MEQASSSKVTVEYFDPYNVYQLLSPGLLPRLPLRNLHWESHAGPLRSIQSLHVDLVSAEDPRPTSSSSNTDLTRVKSSETASGDDGFRVQNLGAVAAERPDSRSGRSTGPVKGRRHQIPGLRQTPYLKVFLLRCDDNETYKASARKQVREWIKQNAPPASSSAKINSQENHDAFEWLIVHVVVPNTAAATQPRIATKGSTPLLEKLRADFNSISKSSVDRIAQIRIGVNDVPYDILPRVVPAIPGSYTETPKEHEESWIDLISKLKALILSSFDMRVSQYEEDVKEKDGQRALPGWNFCTFFVLKEGLARGFENVGLVEDALVGYDELAIGLDAIIRDPASAGPGGSFLPFTADLKNLVETTKIEILREQGIESETDGPIDLQSTTREEEEEIPLIVSKKNYRELILSNDISIFDFRCYLFTRQLALLLRLGNASISKEELLAKLKEQRDSTLQGVAARSAPAPPPEDAEDLSVLGEVCSRALSFISLIARIMRDDMIISQAKSSDEVESLLDSTTLKAIDNIVASFTFSVAQQILAQTSTKSLPIPPSTLAPHTETSGQEPKATIPEPKTMMHPARSSSLISPQSSLREPPSPGIFPGGRRSSVSDGGGAVKGSQFNKPGLEDLAGHRAELYLVSRSVLEHLGNKLDWSVGWDESLENISTIVAMEEISLSDDTPAEKPDQDLAPNTTHGISSSLLKVALSSEENYHRLYETLTDKAMRHYTVASHAQSVQSAMSDLAVLKYHMRDYSAAASYFYRMVPFYGEGGWEEIEMNMLVMYTKCLKELKRDDEYVRVALKRLARVAMREKERLERKSAFTFGKYNNQIASDPTSVDGYLDELMTTINALSHDTTVPLQNFFGMVEVENSVLYDDKRDNFSLAVKFRYLLTDELRGDSVKVRLVHVAGGHSRDILLESEDVILFTKRLVKLQVHSNVIIPGTYTVKEVTINSGKLTLSHEAEAPSSPHRPSPKFLDASRILLYQRPKAFDVQLSPSRYLHLSRTRTLELVISSGWNNVTSGELHVRAATAGLRLQTGEISQVSGDLPLVKNTEPGVIKFGALRAGEIAKLCLPFNIENDVPEVILKIEVSYTTDSGTFFLANQLKLSIQLPLGVNVQDVFKHTALFSKFSITTASASPLRVLGSKLENSDRFEAFHGAELSTPVTVYQKQPATLLYKITRRQSGLLPITKKAGLKEHPILARKGSKENANLALIIYYVTLDEEMNDAITSELEKALWDTPYEPYTKIVVSAVLSELSARMTSIELERTALLNEVSTAVIHGLRWTDHFTGLGKTSSGTEVALSLSQWLGDWQKKVPRISLLPLSIDPDSLAKARSISIPVDIPPVTVVHTAELKIDNITPSSKRTVTTTNQALSATLKIKCTRTWDTKPNDSSAKPEELLFIYEVSAPADSWLIGGKRKGHFKLPFAKEEAVKSMTFPIVMIPIREGYLPYPSVDIRSVPSQQNRIKEDEEDDAPSITCETNYKNIAETIRVMSGARKTTVSLDASGPQGGAWLLESEQRGSGERDLFVR